MEEEKKIRISQCMIVKNEEKNIERALSWGRNIMWEQIVVDTGSTDRTVEIARSMGAKICSFPWIDDFAAAKNFAIEQAEGDWIVLLDADEYMAEEGAAKICQVLAMADEKGMDGLSTGWQQLDDKGTLFSSGTQVRFFRNLPDIRYRRRIHEQLVSTEGRELYLGDVVKEVSIFHTGYQSHAMSAKKRSKRNRRLILEELKEHPQDYEMMGYMGDECLGDNDLEEAEVWYGRSIEQMPEELPEYDQRSAVTFTRLLTILSQKEGALWEDMEGIYEKATEYFPKEADFDYTAGCFWAEQGQASKAVDYLETALKKLEDFGCSNRALLLAANLLEAYDLLVRCCYEAGEKEKCVSYSVTYLKNNRYGMAVLSRLLQTLLQGESEAAVLGFLSRIYDFSSLKDKLFVAKTAQKAGCGGFSGFAGACLFTPDERGRYGV